MLSRRRSFLGRSLGQLGCTLLLGLSTSCGNADPPGIVRPPDILFVSIDTLRADRLGCYGYDRDTSPRLDRLAGEGLLFERAFSHTPFTLTSHMSLFTSLLPSVHGMKRRGPPLHERLETLPEVLSAGGYRTYGSYDGGWMKGVWGFERGFDTYTRHTGVAEAALKTEEFLRGVPPDAPLFVFLHLFDVHVRDLRVHGDAAYRAPEPYEDMFVPHPDVDHRRHLSQDVWDGLVELSAEEAANVRANYDGAIRYLNDILAHIIAVWDRERGGPGASVVLVTSDHGEALGDHGQFNGHGGAHVEGSHVPLLLRLPDRYDEQYPPGSRVPWGVRGIDVAPTLLELAGLTAPDTWMGSSLLRVDDDRPQYFEHRRGADGWDRALTRGHHRIVAPATGDPLLFDLQTDPGELAPIEDQPDLLRDLLEELAAIDAANHAYLESLSLGKRAAEVELDEAERDRLRALGYLTDD